MTQTAAQTKTDPVAVRHVVYSWLLDMLPVASADQVTRFIGNLRLADGVASDRQFRVVTWRFHRLCVTPDIAEATCYRKATIKEIEALLNRKYGDALACVPGFYRRTTDAPFRLNLPFKCALSGYRGHAGNYNGILCQPLAELDRYFLLTSTNQGGPKAIRLTPQDQMYFTQFEEIKI